MRIVINTCYGGFHIPNEFCETHGLTRYENIDRTNPELVEFVESHANKDGIFCEGCAELEVVEIPDTSTDWEVSEYDGMETVIYVLNGKIYHK